MEKLNKTFQSEQILTAAEMNQITGKIDEVIDNIPDVSELATKTEVQDKLDTSTYTSDKATFATKTELGAKQDALVSGTNIKTINSQSLLGEGNIEITVEGGGISDAPSNGKLYGRKDAQWTEVVIPDTSNLATKDELSAKLDTATYNEEKATFALKTEIPDTSNLATKSELSDGLAGKANTSDLSDYLTTSDAQSTYATKSELGAKLDVETYNSDKATFATKTELNEKGYATVTQVNEAVEGKANTSDIPTKVSQLVNDNGYLTEHQDISGLATKEELNTKADKITVEDGGSGTVSKELQPNILYKFGECANLTITLAATTNNADEFMFIFDSGATATVLSIPETVISDSDFVINTNAHYEVSIRDNYLVYKEWIKS